MGIDPRLGRRWNIDPINIGGKSGYDAFGNNPLVYTDPLGLDTVKRSSQAGVGDVVQHRNKNSYFYWNKTKDGWEGNGSSEYLAEVHVTAKKKRTVNYINWPKMHPRQLYYNDLVGARLRDGLQPIQPEDPVWLASQMPFHLQNYNAQQDGRMLQGIFVGGIAAPIALVGSVESGAGYYLYQVGSRLYQGGSWLFRNYGMTFAQETSKKILAARGKINKVDWSDVLISTATSKMGFWGKATGEVVNSLNDFTIDKGFRNTLLGTKDGGSTLIDLTFSFIKTGTGEIGKGTDASKQSIDNLKLLFDQLKTSLKDASH